MFFCQNKVALFLEGLAILPNFFWKDWQSFQTLKLREINHQQFDEFFFVLITFTSFHLHIRNANEVIWQFWDRENSQFVSQDTFQFLCASQFFPIHGLAVVVKNAC